METPPQSPTENPLFGEEKKVMLSHLQDALASAAGNIISLTVIFYNGLKN